MCHSAKSLHLVLAILAIVITVGSTDQITSPSKQLDLIQKDQTKNSSCIFIDCYCGAEESEDTNEGEYDYQNAINTYDVTCNEARIYSNKEFPLRDILQMHRSNYINSLLMSQIELKYVPPDRFANLSIFSFDLSSNQISSLSDDAFRGIIKLEDLDLSRNKLDSLNQVRFVFLQKQ